MIRTKAWAILIGVVLIALAAGAAYQFAYRPPRFVPERLESYYRARPVRPAEPVDVAAVRAGIVSAAEYIKRASQESGQFVYLVNTNPAVPVARGYNLLRHAGTIYSLGMANSTFPDPHAVEVMKRAVGFMRDCCFTRFPDPQMLGIWEPETIVHARGPAEYKLGGAGLGLAALASLAKAVPGAVPLDEMQGLARFGQFMLRWNGEFFSKHIPSQGGRTQPGAVVFYPGEMVLGWLMLHELHPSAELVDLSVKALAFLARERAAAGAAPADHWAVLATARLLRIADGEGREIPRDLMIGHVLQICHTMLEEGVARPALPALEGSLVSAGRGEVTPTSTRLEGLLAALTVLPRSNPITPHIESAVHRGMAFVLRAQVSAGPHRGGIPMAVTRLPDDGSAATATFNDQATEIRIDYVQHALSAMIQYRQWIARQ